MTTTTRTKGLVLSKTQYRSCTEKARRNDKGTITTSNANYEMILRELFHSPTRIRKMNDDGQESQLQRVRLSLQVSHLTCNQSLYLVAFTQLIVSGTHVCRLSKGLWWHIF